MPKHEDSIVSNVLTALVVCTRKFCCLRYVLRKIVHNYVNTLAVKALLRNVYHK